MEVLLRDGGCRRQLKERALDFRVPLHNGAKERTRTSAQIHDAAVAPEIVSAHEGCGLELEKASTPSEKIFCSSGVNLNSPDTPRPRRTDSSSVSQRR